MALQILDRPSWQSLTGQALGQGLGGGIADLLGQLTQKQDIQKQRGTTAQLFQSLGFSPDQAIGIAQQPEALQRDILKQRQEQQKLLQQQQQAKSFAQALGTGAPGQQFQVPEGGQLSERQATQLAKLSSQEKERQSREQERIVAQNKPFTKVLDTNLEAAKPIRNLANEMISLLKTGKVQTGQIGGRAIGGLASAESQRYDQLANQLVLELSERTKGRPTDFKIRLQQLTKPQRTQKQEVQEKRLQDLLNDANEVILQDTIRDQLIQENNGVEPKNLKNLVKRKIQEFRQTNKKKEMDELPDPMLYTGRKIEDDEGTIFQSDGINWVPVGGKNAV